MQLKNLTSKTEYNALLREWEAKLKESGFDDIETSRGELKTWHSQYFQVRHSPDKFEHRAEYFYQATQFLELAYFETQTDRHIWQLHSEGQSLRQIAHAVHLNKDRVNLTVTRLKEVMRRGVRHWPKKKSLKIQVIQLSLFEDLSS